MVSVMMRDKNNVQYFGQIVSRDRWFVNLLFKLEIQIRPNEDIV